MQRDYSEAGAGKRPSVWILILLLLALLGVALVHDPETDAAGARDGQSSAPGDSRGFDRKFADQVPVSRSGPGAPEAREEPQGDVKRDDEP